VICEQLEDELQRYFDLAEKLKDVMIERTTVASSSDSEFPREGSFVPYVDYREKLTRISIAEGFVSILLTYRMGHNDRATAVSYDQSAVRCTLSMPDNLRVSISRGGHYEVSMEDEVNLKVIIVARSRRACLYNIDVTSATM